MKKFLFFLMTLLIMTSCYKEVVDFKPEADLFELYVEDEEEQFIHSSIDTSYTISSIDLHFNGQLLDCKEIRVRGKSALDYHRKSYSVFLNEPIYIREFGKRDMKSLKRLKLLALAMDYTYIENRIAFGILEEAGIMPLFYKFVELKMNNETQGVYLLVEDPEQYYKENGSEFIIRRGYNFTILDSEYHPLYYNESIAEYEKRFKEIYYQLPLYSGQELYNRTAARLDIESYFKKMGIDYLLQNGDYTDEIYLYTRVEQDTIRYQIIPWDYDDIFKDKPHEVGKSSTTGTLFGKRIYNTIEDIYNEIGDKLVYSIEDDLDYTIARDSFLYARYEEAFSRLLTTVNEELIDRVFRETVDELSTYYEFEDIISQSQYDLNETSKEIWLNNMADKKEFLKNRLESIKIKLDLNK